MSNTMVDSSLICLKIKPGFHFFADLANRWLERTEKNVMVKIDAYGTNCGNV